MEIKLNPGRPAEPGTGQPVTRRTPAQPVGDTESFVRTQSLERALQDAPVVRQEKVAHARALVADVKFPPDEMMDRIANLLAIHMNKR